MTPFKSQLQESGLARTGNLNTRHGEIETPILFPVMCFIAGTTINCGGIWKYARDWLLRQSIPMISQTMHFLDFGVSPRSMDHWRSQTLHEWFD